MDPGCGGEGAEEGLDWGKQVAVTIYGVWVNLLTIYLFHGRSEMYYICVLIISKPNIQNSLKSINPLFVPPSILFHRLT